MKKKIIIGILIIIEIGLIMINYNTTLSNKEIDKIETKEETKEIKGNNTLAIMLKSKDGEKYTPSDTNTWPTEEYKYAGSLCIGNDGRDIEEDEVISFDNASHTATITTKDTIYCYLYFAEGENAVDRIERISGDSLENEQDVGAREDVLRRFQGTAEEVQNNYICFGTSITEECVKNTDRYMYRIIGYATGNDETTNTKQGQLKLIKKEALEEAMPWHYNFNDNNINWFQSDLYNRITTKEYLTNKYYVPNGWENKIANHTWWAGDTISTKTDDKNGAEIFAIENGQTDTEYYEFGGIVDETESIPGALTSSVRSDSPGPYKGKNIYYKIINDQKWAENLIAKVGLMNISDYYLSVNANINCFKEGQKCKEGWIHLSNNDSKANNVTSQDPPHRHDWTMSRYGFRIDWGYYDAHYVNSGGEIASVYLSYKMSVRPVIYTTENITLNGSGTIDDPYIIVS